MSYKGKKGIPGLSSDASWFEVLIWKIKWRTPLRFIFEYFYECWKE